MGWSFMKVIDFNTNKLTKTHDLNKCLHHQEKETLLKKMMDSTNLVGIREAGKLLTIGQKQLVAVLLDEKILYRDQNQDLQAYQKAINQNLIKIVVSQPKQTKKGQQFFLQIKLTYTLLIRLAKRLNP